MNNHFHHSIKVDHLEDDVRDKKGIIQIPFREMRESVNHNIQLEYVKDGIDHLPFDKPIS